VAGFLDFSTSNDFVKRPIANIAIGSDLIFEPEQTFYSSGLTLREVLIYVSFELILRIQEYQKADSLVLYK